VRVGERAGLGTILQVAAATGIDNVPNQPAVYLGAFEGTLTEMTAAYSVFPNHGRRHQSYIVERIDDAAGEVLYRAAHVQTNSLDPGVCWLTTSSLVKTFEKGTASTARSLGWTRPSAGKTGTTNDYKDAWFVGYTSSLTCGVWVGLDKPETIMSRGYGSALALPIWVDVMDSAAPKRYPAEQFRPPGTLHRVSVCSVSSQLATSACARAGAEYRADLPTSCVPEIACELHRGGALVETDRSSDRQRRPGMPGNIFRSFQRFFGGK
jgi:penicillin-binding protein 1A